MVRKHGGGLVLMQSSNGQCANWSLHCNGYFFSTSGKGNAQCAKCFCFPGTPSFCRYRRLIGSAILLTAQWVLPDALRIADVAAVRWDVPAYGLLSLPIPYSLVILNRLYTAHVPPQYCAEPHVHTRNPQPLAVICADMSLKKQMIAIVSTISRWMMAAHCLSSNSVCCSFSSADGSDRLGGLGLHQSKSTENL